MINQNGKIKVKGVLGQVKFISFIFLLKFFFFFFFFFLFFLFFFFFLFSSSFFFFSSFLLKLFYPKNTFLCVFFSHTVLNRLYELQHE